ncbi:MAG: hypothetical protein R6U61_08965 [Thermoplasmata archaeon]
MKECPSCARKCQDDLSRCPTCGYPFEGSGPDGLHREGSNKSSIASVMMVSSAIIGIIFILTIAFGFFGVDMAEMAESQYQGQYEEGLFTTVLNVCTVIMAAMAVIQLIGAYFAYKKRKWGIALFGAFAGIALVGFYVSIVLSIISVILLFLAKDEFV